MTALTGEVTVRDSGVDLLEVIKRRFDYDAWQTRTTLVGSMFVWNLTLRGDELQGMRPERVRRIEPAALVAPSSPRQRDAAMAAPAIERTPRVHVQSIWRDVLRPDVLIRADLFECLSQPDAREKVVWLLGECESPQIEQSPGIGDVAFGTRQDGLLLFTRANLVYLLRNLGSRAVSVRTAALALDAHATSTPPDARRRVQPPGDRSETEDSSEIVEVALQDAAGDGQTAGVCRKFVAPEGEIRLGGAAIVYRGPRSGLHALASYEWVNDAPASLDSET